MAYTHTSSTHIQVVHTHTHSLEYIHAYCPRKIFVALQKTWCLQTYVYIYTIRGKGLATIPMRKGKKIVILLHRRCIFYVTRPDILYTVQCKLIYVYTRSVLHAVIILLYVCVCVFYVHNINSSLCADCHQEWNYFVAVTLFVRPLSSHNITLGVSNLSEWLLFIFFQ